MNDTLMQEITAAHEHLDERLARARELMDEHAGRRDIIRATDTFLADECRHNAAVCDLVLPAARRTPEGRALVRRYVRTCRGTERAMQRAKQCMYGEIRASAVPWHEVWTDLVDQVHTLHDQERGLVAVVADPDGDAVVARFADVESHGPTRPHPRSPHVGRTAHLSRWWWSHADRVWDTAEGRITTA